MKQKPVAVIGGSGFVGRHVLRLLMSKGISAINIDLVPADGLDVENRIADICDTLSLTRALDGCEKAIFLAAEWRDDVRPESRYFDVNVGGASNFVAAAKSVGIKSCIFTSSVSVYGPTSYEVEESYHPSPINSYGRSKLEAEDVLKNWSDQNPDCSLVVIRPTVIFGPDNRGNVWNLLNQMANGPFFMIGNGNNKKSMAYVENIAAFIVYQLNSRPGYFLFNYADKPDFDMNTLVSMIQEEMGRHASRSPRIPKFLAQVIASILDRVGLATGRSFGITKERVFKFCANTQYSSGKAMGLGFEPPVELEEALRHTIRIEFGN